MAIAFKKKSFVLVSLILAFLGTMRVEAAGFSITTSTSTIQTGGRFSVSVFMDAENESINATEGRISFPQKNLDLMEVYETDSFVPLWIQAPHQDREGSVVWSGVIPGGFQGILSPYYQGSRPGKLFSLIFEAKQPGGVNLSISNVKALLNDGQGTNAYVHASGASLDILPETALQIATSTFAIPEDKTPPAAFTPAVTRDSSIFDGKWFVAFGTQDKETGVDHYAVYESGRPEELSQIEPQKWTVANSPYLLKDQSLRSYIYVAAVDRAGNVRIAAIPPVHPLATWYESVTELFIILGGLLILFFLFKKLKRKAK